MEKSLMFRESLNLVWAFMSFILAWLFLRRVVRRMVRPGWYASTTSQLMIACGFYFVGSFLSRGMGAWSLFSEDWSQYWISVTGGVIALTACLCMIRVISEPKFGSWGWITSLLLSIALVGLLIAVRYPEVLSL